MIKKKICMVGVFAVGKTSLVQRFVKSIFSEKYLTTVGVKIDKKTIDLGKHSVDLMLWDLQGEDDFQSLQVSYLRGSSGYFLVADGTREWTFDKALTLKEKVEEAVGKLPFMLLINKADLQESWEVGNSKIETLVGSGWSIIRTSAKTGQGVEEAFKALAQKILEV
ncbi:MAG: Rab family GTPase [Desulfomonilaceae bacterium]